MWSRKGLHRLANPQAENDFMIIFLWTNSQRLRSYFAGKKRTKLLRICLILMAAPSGQAKMQALKFSR